MGGNGHVQGRAASRISDTSPPCVSVSCIRGGNASSAYREPGPRGGGSLPGNVDKEGRRRRGRGRIGDIGPREGSDNSLAL